MTDFSTEILPEEEQKTEELLPTQGDKQELRKEIDTSADSEDQTLFRLAGAGNAMLARQLGDQKEDETATSSPTKTPKKKVPPQRARKEKPPVSAAPMPDKLDAEKAKPVPEQPAAPKPEPMLKDAARQPNADPAAERLARLKLLTKTIARLLVTPETSPIEALFAAYLKAPADEQADAALAIANAVLRIDADTRRRARIALARVMKEYKSHPLAQRLAIRFGSWIATAPPPPPPADPGGGP